MLVRGPLVYGGHRHRGWPPTEGVLRVTGGCVRGSSSELVDRLPPGHPEAQEPGQNVLLPEWAAGGSQLQVWWISLSLFQVVIWFAAMESPSSAGRRHAWVYSSRRCWTPLADTEPYSTSPTCTPPPPHHQLSLQDEVFTEGRWQIRWVLDWAWGKCNSIPRHVLFFIAYLLSLNCAFHAFLFKIMTLDGVGTVTSCVGTVSGVPLARH